MKIQKKIDTDVIFYIILVLKEMKGILVIINNTIQFLVE